MLSTFQSLLLTIPRFNLLIQDANPILILNIQANPILHALL